MMKKGFSALPIYDQQSRIARAGEIHALIKRLDPWFSGLPLVTFILLITQFYVHEKLYYLASLAFWILLIVLGGYVFYRGRLITKAGRYLDPDTPSPPE